MRWILLIVTAISSLAHAEVTEVIASVDRNPAMINEEFELVVTANDDVRVNAFPLAELEKNFMVSGPWVSRQMQSVNGVSSRSTNWTFKLTATRSGNYRIPPFTVNGVSSNPIDLQVITPSQVKGQNTQDVFIEVSVDNKEVYLQQQLNYTVKLHLAKDLQSATLTEPVLEDANIKKFDQDKEYTQIISGKRYRVIERSFAIQPQRSGEFIIEGPVFEGLLVVGRRTSLFGLSRDTKDVRILGESVRINVKPMPQDYNGTWLPSELVQLTEEWQPDSQEYKLGEPITRIITLTALGLSEEQLPEINLDYGQDIKTYPDKDETATVTQDQNLIAQRINTTALVPSQTGTLTIPELRIPWFNTNTQQVEYATLPKREIKVVAGNQQAQAPIQQPAQQITPSQPQTVAAQPTVVTVQDAGYWPTLTYLFSGLWLVTLMGWFIHWRRGGSKTPKVKSADVEQTMAESQAWKTLVKAMSAKDSKLVEKWLLQWSSLFFNMDINNLNQVKKLIGSQEFAQQLHGLQSNAYAIESSSWDPSAMQSILESVRHQGMTKPTNNKLKPLYPTN